jgi:peptidylprolyl isomerase
MNVEKGNSLKVHYIGTLNDGTEFDNSYKRGEPIEFQVGSGQLIKGFDEGVLGMSQGEKKTINIPAAEAYGEYDENANQMIGRQNFPEDFDFVIGAQVTGQNEMGMPIRATIKEVTPEGITLDFNHPLAGQELNFELEVVEIN